MVGIKINNVSLDLPILGYNGRSIRKFLLNFGVGGKARRKGDDLIVIRALEKVSFEVKSGERLGILGHNGSGKTTLLRVLSGIYSPSSGEINIEGNVASLLESTFGLNVDATGKENIKLLLTYRGFSMADIQLLQPQIEEFTELGSYLDLPVRTYSSGMLARLGFAVATCYEPEILIMDEWLGAGDENFINKATARVENFVSKANIVVLASHSRDLIKKVCNRAIVLEQGSIVAQGTPEDVFAIMDERKSALVAQ